jgi:hypothetical protein
MLDSQVFCCILDLEPGQVALFGQIGQGSRFELGAAQPLFDPRDEDLNVTLTLPRVGPALGH